MRSVSLLLGALGASLLPGCRGCSEERPYTPFGTTTALPGAEPSPSSDKAPVPSASASSGAARSVEKSVLAPSGSRTWQLGEQDSKAPPGTVFNQAVRARFGDTDETLTWLESDGSDAGSGPAAALWVFPSSGEPRQLVELPGFVPSGPGCKLVTSLERTGPHSVTLDVRGDCAGALIARAPLRALVVVAPDADPPELLSLRVAGPAPGETLELAATTTDRDGDGRDDIAVDVSVGTTGGPSVNVPLVWLDRAAGRSRDSAATQGALVRLAQHEAARAKSKKLAVDVLQTVGNVRRLMASLCAEGATPRVLDADGNPLGCGSLSVVVDALASAEVTANLARGDVLDAFGALARDGWYFGRMSAPVRQKLERQLFDAVTPESALVKTLDPRPLLGRAPRYSPFAFDASGGVLVQTFSGVVRTAPDGTGAAPLPDAGAPRSLDVLAAPGRRFSAVVYSCDRSEVALMLDGAPPLVTSLLSPRPGACGHAPFLASDVPPPIAAGGGHLSIIVGGAVLGDAEKEPRLPGSASSANGRWLVVPTAYGLLVDGASHRLIQLGTVVRDPLALTDCVVNDAGDRAVCALKGQTLLIESGAAATPAP